MAMTGGTAKLVHTGGNSGYTIKCYVYYKSKQNIDKNESTITTGFYIDIQPGLTIGPWSDWYGSYVGDTKNTFNGSVGANTTGVVWLAENKSFTVNHNADGTAVANIKWKWGVSSPWGGCVTPSGSFNVQLPQIPRKATITSAPNFTDEQNPCINYSNLAGAAVTSIEACISYDGVKDDIAYRPIDKFGTAYTFDFTKEEREKLRLDCINSESRNVFFILKTTIGGKIHYSQMEKTLTIANANPTLAATVEDVNPDTLALTGNKDTFIKYLSNAKYNIQAQAYKHATIKETVVTNGSQTLKTATGTINAVEAPDFIFVVKDSRGIITAQTQTKTLIDYFKPTIILKVDTPKTNGDIHFTAKGDYFNKSFGLVENTLTATYSLKENGREWTPPVAIEKLTLNQKSYSIDFTITGLNYRSSYELKVEVTDKLSSAFEISRKLKAIPVFDWGKDDFNFNVPVTFNGNPLISMLYPIGSYYWTSEKINPNEVFGGEWEQITDRFVYAAGNTITAGTTGGEAEHTLTIEEMPSHKHTFKQYNNSGYEIQWAAKSSEQIKVGDASNLIKPTGGGKPHNNMPPYIAAYCWHRIG